MTVIQPNSISGINSITVQSGEGLSVHKSDGSLIREIVSATGVGTFYALNVGSATSVSNRGDVAISGIVTANGGVKVAAAATISTNGNATFSGVTTAKAADLQTGPLNVGSAATIAANGNASFSGVVTSTEYFKNGTIVPMGVGIGSTGNGDWSNFAQGLVGYGFTYLSFVGSGVSMVRYNSSLGIATVLIQGGGGTAGAAGTWSAQGTIGVSTSKSVGVNTVSMTPVRLQGVGNTFQGLYVSNGMVVFDNTLNGNHYIGTYMNGVMGGPVTVNGVMTVDGNWAVV